ncbi:Uncharacterised protein [Burkholderia pseudomallei]|uniref:hypothetical protein n=1 Tax=Burkholderia pseudomallei TaxID=28450 RepID=UPI000F083D46|nr:hypothetical protein [Burkholderia pseudomallei]CAJ7880648.1 Uncharacterised protein [Burkholderia pseudomallei]VBP35468.1 Uncharacterised protein [Burkholderia pseudomallei]
MSTAQISLPVEVSEAEIAREKSLGAAISLCAKVAGFDLDKELQMRLGVDKAQFSRWLGGTEGIVWPKFVALMDVCGNDAPLLWMLHQRGFDLGSLRKRESETERENRLLREENAALRRILAGDSK